MSIVYTYHFVTSHKVATDTHSTRLTPACDCKESIVIVYELHDHECLYFGCLCSNSNNTGQHSCTLHSTLPYDIAHLRLEIKVSSSIWLTRHHSDCWEQNIKS